MAEFDGTRPQVNDSDLETELIRILQVTGPLGKLNVADIVLPVVNLGDAFTRTVEVRQPNFTSGEIFSNGVLSGPAVGTVLADTGALVAGVYDVVISGETADEGSALSAIKFEHRDAANAANLAVWNYLMRGITAATIGFGPIVFAYEFAVNERLRALNTVAASVNQGMNAVIFASRRT